MKKKLFIALASVFALASCAKFSHDIDFKAVTTGAPIISQTDSTETSIKALITPSDENTVYYSYAVLKGAFKAIDEEALLSASIKSAIASECCNIADSAKISLEVADLEKGETYTLYAIASTKTGTLSPLTFHTFILDDKTVPSPMASKAEFLVLPDSSVVAAIPFDRNIKLGKDAKVRVRTWGALDPTKLQSVVIQGLPWFLNQHPLETIEISGESLTATDNCLGIVIPKELYQAGKFLSITFDAGTVLSLPVSAGAPADIPCKAYSTEYLLYAMGPYSGIFYQYEAATFTFEEAEGNPEFVIAPLWADAKFSLVSSAKLYGADSEGVGDAIYSIASTGYSSERKATIAKDQIYMSGIAADTVTLSLPVAPVAGERVVLSIEEGKFYDIFGNTNEAFETTSTPVGALEFTFKDIKAGCNNLYATVVAAVDGVYFVCDYYKGAASDSSDATLIKNMKDAIQKWATTDQITFEEEYVMYFANTGEGELEGINLNAETKYTAYAFFMQPDGTVISDVYRKEITTAKFEWPNQTKGTFTYATSPFKSLGAVANTPIAINATKDTVTISNFGTNAVDLKCTVDASGYLKILTTPCLKHATYGLIYATEIDTWYKAFYGEDWGSFSYYNSLDNTIYFNIVYHISTGGYFGVGQYDDTFKFDDAAPTSKFTRKAAAKSARKVSAAKSKIANMRIR